jgi:hypothetical protein
MGQHDFPAGERNLISRHAGPLGDVGAYCGESGNFLFAHVAAEHAKRDF